jgi:hypothetical protein
MGWGERAGAKGDARMALFIVFATVRLRPAVAAIGSAFYMPFEHVALVSFGGSAAALAQHLSIDQNSGPPAFARCFSLARLLSVVGGIAGLATAIEMFRIFV